MVALRFKETTVNPEQTQFAQDRAGLFSRFTPSGLNQCFARLYAPDRQVPAIRVGVFDEENAAVLHGKKTNSNGQGPENAPSQALNMERDPGQPPWRHR